MDGLWSLPDQRSISSFHLLQIPFCFQLNNRRFWMVAHISGFWIHPSLFLSLKLNTLSPGYWDNRHRGLLGNMGQRERRCQREWRPVINMFKNTRMGGGIKTGLREGSGVRLSILGKHSWLFLLLAARGIVIRYKSDPTYPPLPATPMLVWFLFSLWMKYSVHTVTSRTCIFCYFSTLTSCHSLTCFTSL